MLLRNVTLVAMAAMLSAGLCQISLAAEKPAEVQSVTGVFKFNAVKPGSVGGKPGQVISATSMITGRTEDLAIPNTTNAGKTEPDQTMFDIAKAAKPGDMFEITMNKTAGKWIIGSFQKYELKPGEDEPNVYVFGGKTTAGEQSAITVTKFGQSSTLVVPNKKGADGKMAPDAEIAAKIDALTSGASIEVQIEKSGNAHIIRGLKPYVAPQRVELVKVIREKVGDKDATGIETKDNGKIFVNPKSKDMATLVNKVKSYKPGQALMVKTETEGDTTWLTDVKPAPKEPAPAKEGNGVTK